MEKGIGHLSPKRSKIFLYFEQSGGGDLEKVAFNLPQVDAADGRPAFPASSRELTNYKLVDIISVPLDQGLASL